MLLVSLRETSRSLVGNGSVPPAKWNRSLLQVLSSDLLGRPTPESAVETLEKPKYRASPLNSFRIFRDKEMAILILYGTVLWAGCLTAISTLSSQLERRYGLSTVDIGLCYIPLAVGAMLSRWTAGVLLDWNFKRAARREGLPVVKNKQQDLTNFNAEAARLTVAMPFVGCACLSMIAYGWTMEFHTPLAAPLVMLFFNGLFATGAFTALTTLGVDIMPGNVTSAAAAGNLVRCLFGAGAVAVTTPLINAIGIGWTCTMVAFLWLLVLPMVWAIYRNGHRWRIERAAKPRPTIERA